MQRIEINFLEYDRKMKQGEKGRSLLLKATGLSKMKGLHILDATAGLMRDAYFMAKFGGIVTAVERSPQLAEMIDAALKNLPSPLHIEFRMGNAIGLIPILPVFDVIYLDPMFKQEKSAKAKKDLQFLQSLHVNEIDDSVELLRCARSCARLRVVVKRAYHAAPLGGLKPDWSCLGKTIRFDVYARPQ